MGLLTDILTFPVSGPIKGFIWLAETLKERAEGELYNEDAVRARLMELELKLDMGEITEEEYQTAEDELVDLLVVIRARRDDELGS
jgi:hypothetical protein